MDDLLSNGSAWVLWSLGGSSSAALLLLLAGATASCVVLRRPGLIETADTIVVAPHQDDCLILAGEWVLDAVQRGRDVRIVYVTAGDITATSELSIARVREAREVWSLVGLPAEHIVDLLRPQSPIGTSALWSSEDEAVVEQRLRQIVTSSLPGTHIIIPADYEQHFDHRVVRRLTIKAVEAAGRTDLVLLESAEYNEVYNLFASPCRVLKYVIAHLPIAARLRTRLPDGCVGFAGPGRVLRIAEDAVRRDRKAQLMRGFVTQYNAILAGLARQTEQYRRVVPPYVFRADDEVVLPFGYLQFGRTWLHWSVVALWVGLAGVVLAVSGLLTSALIVALSWNGMGLAFILLGVGIVEAWRRRALPERAMLSGAFVFGIAATLLIHAFSGVR